MNSRLVLSLLIAGCLVLGSIVFVELQSSGAKDTALAEVSTRSDPAPAVRRQQKPQSDELLAVVLARPLFSSTRRPPQTASSATTDSDLADTRLTGIVTDPRRRLAIFAVNGDKPLRLGEGEAVSGWRIESITPREVSLSGPAGTKTLQPKMDPNLVPPPGQPIATAAGRPPAPPAAGRPSAPPPTAAARPPTPPPSAGAQPPSVPINNPGALPRPPRLRQQH